MTVNDALVHELDALRVLLDDDRVSAQIVFLRRSNAARPDLRDPQIALLETLRGVRIDVEICVNCRYGYNIHCEIVGENGTASLPEPPSVSIRRESRLETAISTEWRGRFAEVYDRELCQFVAVASEGAVAGPSAWHGHAAAVYACVAAPKLGGVEPIAMPEALEFYRS